MGVCFKIASFALEARKGFECEKGLGFIKKRDCEYAVATRSFLLGGY